jgi:hypothetical protein
MLDIEEIKSISYTPRSHRFIERPTATIRREVLDRNLFCHAAGLEQKLETFKAYYYRSRTHVSVDGNTPPAIIGGSLGLPISPHRYTWKMHCAALLQIAVAA